MTSTILSEVTFLSSDTTTDQAEQLSVATTSPVLAKAVTPPKMSAPPPPMARAAANGAAQLRRSRVEPIEPKVLRIMSPFDLNH